MSGPLSIEIRELCRASMPPYWTDNILETCYHVVILVCLSVLTVLMHVACCNIILSLSCMVFNPYPFFWAVLFVTILYFSRLYFPPFCPSPLSHVISHHLSVPTFIQCHLYFSLLMKATMGCQNIYKLLANNYCWLVLTTKLQQKSSKKYTFFP